MSDHASPTVERHCDVLVVGGSAAGLAAALQLARQRRSVIVVDSGEPRNAPASHMHGYLGHEAAPPSLLTSIGRDEVRSYGGEVLRGRVVGVARSEDRFRADLLGGHAIVARRVIIATGLVDVLPDIDGLEKHWGRDVIHCPFCHGFEVRDRRVVQIVTHPMALHPTPLFRQLTADLTVVLHDDVNVDAAHVDEMRAAGVTFVSGTAAAIDEARGRVSAVGLSDGRRIPADAVAIAPRFRARAEPFEDLGIKAVPHPSGLGDVVEADPMGATGVPGVYAAGNVTDPSQQVLHAAANGSRVGAVISFSLADEDIGNVARPSSHAADWDHRYSGERLWSGNPNGSLVREVTELQAARALDVGAGEGGDAIWLAERGWRVTATDVSKRALGRVGAEAERRNLRVELLHADANALDIFQPDAYDLVSALYASIPRTPDGRAVRNLLRAVAPGGTLLVVSHDLEPMRTPIDTTAHSQAFDPDAYVRVEDIAVALDDDPDWDIEVHEKRLRSTGAASSQHVDDIVLRARRRAT